ncbi:hypothetical protein ACOMHN_062736 [Nucella lapillus]
MMIEMMIERMTCVMDREMMIERMMSMTCVMDREMMTKEMIQLPLTIRDVEQDYDAWTTHKKSGERGVGEGGGEGGSPQWRRLAGRLGRESWPLEPGEDCVSSSHLPSHSDVHVSVLTAHRIRETHVPPYV